MLFVTLAALLAVAAARPSFIAVPADQIAFVDLSSLHVRRVPRQALAPPPPHGAQPYYEQDYQPIQIQHYQQQPVALAPQVEPIDSVRVVQTQQQQDASGAASVAAASQLAERPPDFGEYVDFGAHTGDHGAFGWYADYPINNHDDSGYRK